MKTPALIVIAKEPLPGRVKTRLSPHWTPETAAAIAEAALADTLAAVVATPASRRVLALDGAPGQWLPSGFEVIAQTGGSLDRRLAAAFEAVGEPALVIGMDTPQVTAATLRRALASLADDGADAVLGPAEDGGYWALGLTRPDRRALLGVPMSSPLTMRAQRARLRALGLRTRELERLRDVDTPSDARAIARLDPGSRFAAAVRAASDTRNRTAA